MLIWFDKTVSGSELGDLSLQYQQVRPEFENVEKWIEKVL